MGGRRRRTSDSTTRTLDYDGQTFAEESSVLKTFQQELEDKDPMLQTFILEDATVCDKKGRPVELFTVNTDGPFVVRGRVVIEEAQKSRALKPSTRTALIETRECTRYAIGVSDTGYGAWAGGRAGWYEIRPPSETYREIYDHTIEGVSIYYTMLAIIEEHDESQGTKRGKKKGKKTAARAKLSLESLLLKYAVTMGDGATYDEVVARCDDHAQFLISHFYEDSDAFDWTPTIFFEWIVARHPGIHAKVLDLRRKRAAGIKPGQTLPGETQVVQPPVLSDEPPAKKALSKRRQRNMPLETNASNHGVETNDFAAKRDTRSRSRGKTKTQSRSPSPAVVPSVETMDVDADPEAPIQATDLVEVVHNRSNVDAILEGIEEIKAELSPLNTAAFSKVSSKLYYKYKIKVYYAASDILKYYAKELVERLDQEEWAGSGFWDTLQQAAQGPRTALQHVKLHQIPESLVRRKVTAVSAPRNRGKTLKTDSGQGETHKAAAVETPPPRRPGRPAGKMSGLRLVGTGGKRRFDSADDTPEAVSRRSKAAKRLHGYDSEEDEAMNDATSSDDDESSVVSTESPTALKVVVRAENIPTTIPKGPQGTWVCDEEDCGFVERNPEAEDGRDRIREHMQEVHYLEDENRLQRISLAVTEGGKNRLPIDHLLEKIRRMGHKLQAKEEIEIDDVAVPQPIKRRLIT
ncbi:hypothetical protein EsH8_III_000575 [Colletotrichum jinshuiense]